MEPLIALLVTFFTLIIVPGIRERFGMGRIGMIAMGVMLLFTAIGHFKYLKGMALMIPSFFPFPQLITIVTCVFEIVAWILLITGKFNKGVVWCVLLFFIVVLPANINASIRHVIIKEANYTGPGAEYLWFRIPLQVFFIFWLYFFYNKATYRSRNYVQH
jgi:uncharacterized membrane protein